MEAPLISQERFRRSPPYPDPLPKFVLPSIETVSLTNGLTLSVIRRENHPTITMKLIILSGESSSPNELSGLATITAKMIGKGTTDFSSDEIEEVIESIGGDFYSNVYPDHSDFTFSFLEEHLGEALRVFSSMILNPSFPGREFNNVKRALFFELSRQMADPDFIARRLLFKILFAAHPYRNLIIQEDLIRRFDRRNIISFYETYYRPNNAHLIIVGDISLSAASRNVSRYMNTWEKKDLTFITFQSPSPSKKTRICFVLLPQAREATIYLGNIIFPVNNPDYFPFMVWNHILGGTPNSRLFLQLRESKGYAYFAFSEGQFFKHCGVFFIRIKTRPDVSYDSITEALKELEKMIREEIPSNEMEQAKSYLIGNFPLSLETSEDLSDRIASIQAFSLGGDHWNKYNENVMLINTERVTQIGKKYPFLTPVVVIVGDQDTLRQLERLDNIEVYDLKGLLQYQIRKGERE
jgi:zinc protease